LKRWLSLAFATSLLALAGAWSWQRTDAVSGDVASPAPSPVVTLAPTDVLSAVESVPPQAPAVVLEAAAGGAPSAASEPADAGAYDDAHLYRVTVGPERLPATAQGVLEAFGRVRQATGACLSTARRENAALTSLQSLEVRISAQDDGSAAVEEVRLPTSNDPALDFRGCLVAALVEQRFERPPEGSVRLTLPIELSP
jgi:hypothetical protein